jgi:hypothetical protein
MKIGRSAYRVCLAFLMVALYAWPSVSCAGFGKDWVRNHNFTVTSIVLLSDHLDMYVGTGFNVLLGWRHRGDIFAYADDNNLPWFINAVYPIDVETLSCPEIVNSILIDWEETTEIITNYEGCEGLFFWDEPKPNEIEYLRNVVQLSKAVYPEKLVYTNMNPYNTYDQIHYDYSDHVTDVINTGVDVISADAYPYFDSETDTRNFINIRFFSTLDSLRNRATAADIPYWFFLQTSDQEDYRLPSQSDLRFSMFAPLAYGFTGLQSFMYWHPESNNILRADGTPGTLQDLKHYAEDAISEVANFGRTLRFLHNKLVRYIKSQPSNILPRGTIEFEGSPSNPVGGMSNIEILTIGIDNNGLIGFFEDDNNHNYLMIVNVKRAAGKSAWDTRLDFRITLQPWITSLYKMNRDTGQIENVPIINNQATITVLGGTGEFFKINSPSFVGVQ